MADATTAPSSALDVAKTICELGDWKVTNLALQKILYILQMFYMGNKNGTLLLRDDFEAWDLGPVVPSVYHKAKIFGSSPIKNVFPTSSGLEDDEQKAWIEEHSPPLLKMSPGRLVSITHWKQGAWAQSYERGLMGIVIPKQEILAEFKRRADRMADRAQ